MALNSSQAEPAVIFDDVSALSGHTSWSALNVEEELLKRERQYYAEATLSETEYARRLTQSSVPYLPLTRYYPNSEMFFSQDSAQNYWLNIKSQYSSDEFKENLNYFITGSNDILLNNRCQKVRNDSAFWQILTDAMINSLLVLI